MRRRWILTQIKQYGLALIDPSLIPTAVQVAIVVGSVLLTINHGAAILSNTMTRDRWISALLTYCVPYLVNIHGQFVARSRHE